MTTYIPHTEDEINMMLTDIGNKSLDDLHTTIPVEVLLEEGLGLPPGISEADVVRSIRELADSNIGGYAGASRYVNAMLGERRARNPYPLNSLVCFAGGGAYDHYVPPVVSSLASKSEFVTSYTPYQAEVSQGVLQALFEYQTMMSRISGLPVANASLYDGASALYEAVNMAVSYTDRHDIWISCGVNPRWRSVLDTLVDGRNIKVHPIKLRDASTDWGISHVSPELSPPAAIVIAYPNYLGALENIEQARELADGLGSLLIVAFNPISMGMLPTPGYYGADIAIAEGQPLGIGLSFGGPYLGILSCREEYMRIIPGRVIGESTDNRNRRAYTMTLRTREQDIRRERATSNVCTNQTLMAITATIYLSWLGPAGLKEVSRRCYSGAHYLHKLLCSIDGVEALYNEPFFNEFALKIPVNSEILLARLADEGFIGGVALDNELYDELYDDNVSHVMEIANDNSDSSSGHIDNSPADGKHRSSRTVEGKSDNGRRLLIAVTEKRTIQEIESYALSFEKALQ